MKQRITNMIHLYFNGDVRKKLQTQAEQIGLKGWQAIEIINITKDSIKEVLQAELRNGHYGTVLHFLKNYSLNAGKDLMLDKIMQRVVGRLIIRFGLPSSIAVTLATLLVPFLVKRLGAKALKSGKVQDLLSTLGVHDKAEKWHILRNQVKDRFSDVSKAAA